ncbi:Holliday junction branch migration protein RuvA [Pikeienuella piscinae]|uniref:Holliday junction branch migration complex subunit RuvA n=1 Tax=Pikeienuella piscinae TaxID=2748098 RepID=A0A7L5BVB6_9RHOB|nr:Holliday junction branch migration protein RuvA [Pikeienuella piscinae]QIE55311.1 Holliday junction branch migration protein RuvA [Pikeienuella piscinae]
MIGRITGRVDYVAADHALIETGGVGYELWCSARTLAALPPPGEVAALYTTLLVREDLLQLFGFLTREEREWHRLLTSVQGVGAKVGLAILGALGPEGAGQAIALGDAAAVKTAPGVGPKLAQRIVMELKGKVPAMMALGGRTAPGAAQVKPAAGQSEGAARIRADALSALVNLGYQEGEAAAAIATVEAALAPDAPALSDAALIRATLKTLSR